MAFYSTDDFLKEAGRQIDGYERQLTRFDTLANDTKAKRQDLQTRLSVAYADLGSALLPELSAVAFDELANRIGLPELRTIYQNGVHRQTQIDQRLDEIESSDLYRNREQRAYDLQKQMDEVRPAYDMAHSAWDAMNHIPRLRDLVERQYGTPNYPHRGWLRFFNGQYLADWRRTDEIVAEYSVSSFVEVISRYRERQEQVQVLGRSVNELDAGLKAIQTVLQERDSLLTQRERLPQLVQQKVGHTIAPVLSKIDISALPNPDTLRSRAVLLDGMEHQVQYLDDLVVRIEEDRAKLQDRYLRLSSERDRYAQNRYRYRNKRFSQEQFNKRFDRSRIDRYDVLYNRYDRMGTTIYVFDDYYRVSPLEEFLWWDIMTDGRLNGSFIPEVQQYYDMHPDYSYQPDYYDRSDYDSGVAAGAGYSDFADNS
jgi:hypothetical protein